MTVHDLNRDQLIHLKCCYMDELADEGTFREIMGCDCDEPSWGHLANADTIIPDEVIYEHYAGISFVEEDFWCNLKEDRL